MLLKKMVIKCIHIAWKISPPFVYNLQVTLSQSLISLSTSSIKSIFYHYMAALH